MAQTMLLSRVSAAASALSSKHVAEAEASLRAREFLGARHPSALSAFSPKVRGVQLRVADTTPGKTFALFKNTTKKKDAPKKKPSSTEDGVFGTSGGIGFTKQNELFVGRVAMLGFAASILGEALSGKGTLAQFDIETGIPLYETEPLLIGFILFTLLGAIGALGDRGRFVDDANTGGVIPPGKGLKPALGLQDAGPLQTPFGFTKANELFVGRLAQLGIAFSIIGEIITGKGTLAQLNFETGVPISEIEPIILFQVIFFFIAAINPGTGKFIGDDDE